MWKEWDIKRANGADAQKSERKRRRGSQSMRWEDCDNGDLEIEGEKNGGIWSLAIENSVREK